MKTKVKIGEKSPGKQRHNLIKRVLLEQEYVFVVVGDESYQRFHRPAAKQGKEVSSGKTDTKALWTALIQNCHRRPSPASEHVQLIVNAELDAWF